MNSNFYYNYFGITKPPFGISPQPEYFFGGASREQYLRELIYFAKNGEGIALITGEVGSGKTMEISMLLREIAEDKELITILINSSMQNLEELIRAIALQLEIFGEKDLRIEIEKKLIENFAKGFRTLVVIDEAQQIPKECLEFIRLLSNLETSQGKMLQTLLSAQPEILSTLANFDLRSFCDRITLHITIRGLNQIEIRNYLEHRLRLSGYRGDNLFDDGAINEIFENSGGLNRKIHLLADKALMAAYVDSSPIVTEAHIKKARREIFNSKNKNSAELYKPIPTNSYSSFNKTLQTYFPVLAITLIIVLIALVAISITQSYFLLPQGKIANINNVNSPKSQPGIKAATAEVTKAVQKSQPSTKATFPQVLVKVSEEKIAKDRVIKEVFTVLSPEEINQNLEKYNRKINWEIPDDISATDSLFLEKVFTNSKIALANTNDNSFFVRIYSQKVNNSNDLLNQIKTISEYQLPRDKKYMFYRYENFLRIIVLEYNSAAAANNQIRQLINIFQNKIPTNSFHTLPITHLYIPR